MPRLRRCLTNWGGELTEDELASAESYAQQMLDNNSDGYAANGIGLATLQQYARNQTKVSDLLELVYGEEGETPVSDDELLEHLSNMVYAYYVTVPLYNTSTYVFATDDQSNEMLALCEEAAAAYNAEEDPSLSTFYNLMSEYLPQVYAVLDGEYTTSDLVNNLQLELISESDFENLLAPRKSAAHESKRWT